jgi:hypothetical protein
MFILILLDASAKDVALQVLTALEERDAYNRWRARGAQRTH